MLNSLLIHFVSGHYVYTEVTNRTGVFADAHLISPFFRQAGKTCKLQFWYHMWGPNIGYLQVYYRRNSRDKQLFNIFGNQGNQWKQGMVDIPKCANDFQVSGFRLLNKPLLQFCGLTFYLLQICVALLTDFQNGKMNHSSVIRYIWPTCIALSTDCRNGKALFQWNSWWYSCGWCQLRKLYAACATQQLQWEYIQVWQWTLR